MQRKVMGALLVALTFGVVACGSASKPLTTAQFQSQVGAICRDVRTRGLSVAAAATPATMRSSQVKVAAIYGDGAARMDKVTAPTAMQQRYARLKAWYGTEREAILALAETASRPTARERASLRAHHNPVSMLATSLGVRACV